MFGTVGQAGVSPELQAADRKIQALRDAGVDAKQAEFGITPPADDDEWKKWHASHDAGVAPDVLGRDLQIERLRKGGVSAQDAERMVTSQTPKPQSNPVQMPMENPTPEGPGNPLGRLRSLFEARDADTGVGVHLMMAALIRARREQTYEVESLCMMLTSEHWIPVEGVHELPLIQALVAHQRRFVKPLRYDARGVSEFANALLLDAGPTAVPLHLLSPFMNPTERASKERAIAAHSAVGWVWRTEDAMPSLPVLLTPIPG